MVFGSREVLLSGSDGWLGVLREDRSELLKGTATALLHLAAAVLLASLASLGR